MEIRKFTNCIPLLAIPVLNRGDLLERFVYSVDYPVNKLYIINNGNDPTVLAAIEKFHKGVPNVQTVEVYTPEKNLGVAPSWNAIIQNNLDMPYWIISANDMMFQEGEARKMAEFAEANYETHAMFYADGYSCFSMTQRGLKEVGLFDENIFPAYLEDSDHFYRLRLSGARSSRFHGVKMIHGEVIKGERHVSSTINSNAKYKVANRITHGRNFEYYIKKWGGRNGQEKFTRPFNNPENPLDFWELDLEWRKLQEDAWK